MSSAADHVATDADARRICRATPAVIAEHAGTSALRSSSMRQTTSTRGRIPMSGFQFALATVAVTALIMFLIDLIRRED